MARILVLLMAAHALSGCMAAAVVGAAGAVVGTAAKTAGTVVGAGVDAVTPGEDDEEDDE
jgi:hypothetical protein